MSEFFNPHPGDRVCAIEDPRHIGKVIRVKWSNYVDIKWEDTGWLECDVPVDTLRKARWSDVTCR
jgi:hypothetical protein